MLRVTDLNSDNSPLRPYLGARDNLHRPGERLDWYGFDNAATYARALRARAASPHVDGATQVEDACDYSFNRCGYRGEEYDPNAKVHIAACGCSYTFGNGIRWEQTYAYRFKCLVADHYGFARDEVNLLNFSQGGASNDYISRTLLTQVSSFQPDLVLCYFTHQDRKEFVDEERIYSLGPWELEWEAPSEPSANYYAYYSDEIGFIDAVRNILLVQYFLKAHRIPYLFGWAEVHNLADQRFLDSAVCRSYAELIDRTYLADFTLNREDLARDNNHPGPRANEIFAGRLFDFHRIAHPSVIRPGDEPSSHPRASHRGG